MIHLYLLPRVAVDRIHLHLLPCVTVERFIFFRMLQCCNRDVLEPRGFIFLLSVLHPREFIFIFSYVLQPRGSSSYSSSPMCCSQEDLHLLQCLAAKLIFMLFNVLHHLHLQCVAAELITIFIFFSHVLQLRGGSSSSSHMCYN